MKTVFICLLVLFIPACGAEEVNPGEVALVNGKARTVKQLQAAHDAQVLGADTPGRAVDALRKEYGSVLSELVIQELVAQELEKRNLQVTGEELAKAEQELRQDFPPGGFERMLLEESIDVDLWRDFLRKRLGMYKFNSNMLRSQVAIDAGEVDDYYRTHEEDFKVPERLNFIQFSSLIKDQVVAACEQFHREQDPAAIQERFHNMNIRMVIMREDRLAPDIVKAMTGLQPLEASTPLEINGEYVAMVLLAKEKARLLSREEIYSRIEALLLEDKMQTAFEDWLQQKIAKSTIKVSAILLPQNLR
jgi:parvulin-like peptidyl-prolyl isomerase